MMRKFLKLSRDTRPQNQPEGTYPYGKNGIQDVIKGSSINEPGFVLSNAQIPYTPIGVLETDRYPVIFSTDNVHSAWGYYDYDQDLYQPIFDDADKNFKVGFHTDRFITGQTQRNYKGELVGAFTDKYLPAFYANFDNPDVDVIEDLYLFPRALPPRIELQVQSGGTLLPGAYYVAARYQKNDGTETAYLMVSSPKIIAGTSGQVTDKGLEINISEVDPHFEKLQLAIISKIGGVVRALQLNNPYTISDSGTVFYSGAEFGEPISMEEILTPMAHYDSVGTIGQLNDALYLAKLKSPKKLKLQQYANLIRLKWHSTPISVEPVNPQMATGEIKSFMHEEVGAFYIRYQLTSGKTTDAFVIPGPALTAAEKLGSLPALGEGINAQVFQIHDTIPSFDRASRSGYFGKWQNTTETYPDTEDFDSSAIGGENLRGQPVRHHRFPSIRWCKENLYSGDVDYGRNKLDMLGISVENVIIPAEYQDQITGWEIFYAKRTVGNSTVLGQSLLLFGCRNKFEPKFFPSTYYSSGGNWDVDIRYGRTERMKLFMDCSIARLHPFDVLFNKPSLSEEGNYISMQLKLSRRNIPQTDGYMEDGSIDDGNDAPIVYKFDYIQKGTPPVLPAKQFKRLDELTYMPNNVPLGKWDNKGLEACVGARIAHAEDLIGTPSWLQVSPSSANKGVTGNGFSVQQEETFLTNIMSIRQNLYTPFTGQSLVRAGQSRELNTRQIFYGGDTYICDYSFHTYGTWVSNMGNSIEEFYKGTKVVRRFLCETAANLYSRFEEPGNPYSRYYPKSPLVMNPPTKDANYLTTFSRDKDPNQFGYTKDSNAQDDLIVSSIFNPYVEQLNDHPYRIHRGGKLSRQTKFRSWRTFLPLDYYELQKNMGEPVHVEGMDDRLLIHCENALFLTQDKTKLESDLISVTLGSGDIFQFEPQEGLSAKLGYAGTQHPLACVRTPFGYVFIDSKQGQVFVYKGELKLINNMMDTFFQQFLRLKEQNVFTSNGYTIGYDPTYKRLLLTAKNRKLRSDALVEDYDPAKVTQYSAGTLLRKNGRIVRFLGLNNPELSGVDCEAGLIPIANDLELTIPENTAVGTHIGTLTGTNVSNYYINGNSSPFRVEAATGKIFLASPLNFFVTQLYEFSGSGMYANRSDAFQLTVNVTHVNEGPMIQDAEINILDTTTNGVVVHEIQASDREWDSLTFSIAGGNTANAFAVNPATGAITVADQSQLNGVTLPRYELLINATDGTLSAIGRVVINVIHINEAPVVDNHSVNIDDLTPSNTLIFTVPEALDLEGDNITYTLISESVSGVFTFDPLTRNIHLSSNELLDPSVLNQYTLTISAHDGQPDHEPQQFIVTINVGYNRRNLIFAPDQLSCGVSASCEEGWTLSADGSTCTRVSTTPATINQQNSCLAASTNPVYGEYGARIYNPGFVNNSLGLLEPAAGQVEATMATAYWKSLPNILGIWVDTDCDGVKNSLVDGAQTTVHYRYNNTGSARRVYVGVFGDNTFELKVNDLSAAATIGDTSDRHFKFLHLIPVNITNGENVFNLVATGDGSTNDAVGMIIFDNTSAELQAASMDSQLNILFRTDSLRGGASTIATCPAGYVLDMVDGAPICKKIENTAPTMVAGTQASWAKVKVTHRVSGATLALLENDVTEKYFQNVRVPYYSPVANSADCGAATVAYYNALAWMNAQKADCPEGVGSLVEYAVPAGIHRSLVSQQAANTLAANDIAANKQAYANQYGKCL